MAQKHSVELVCAKDDDETAGLRDEIKENLEKKGVYTISCPTENFGHHITEDRTSSSKDTPFVVFLWSQNAVNDTQFQLLSLTAERKQVEDRVVRCINVLLDQDVNIAHIKQENYKLKWPITPLDDKKQKMGELAEKLHEVMQDPKSKIHQRIGNVSEGLVWNYLVVYLKTILDKENGYWSKLKNKKTLSNNENMDQKAREYILIIPKTGYCPERFEEYLTPELDCYKSFDSKDDLEIKVDDAGMQDRPFKATIRRFHDEENNQNYYFIGEFANPVNTLYKLWEEDNITDEQRRGFVKRFRTRLTYILDHDHVGLKDTYKIIDLNDEGDNGEKISPEEAGTKLKNLLLQELRQLCAKTKEESMEVD